MTAAQLRAFGSMPFSLKVWPKGIDYPGSRHPWPNYQLRDANGRVICAGVVRLHSLASLTAIVFESQRASV